MALNEVFVFKVNPGIVEHFMQWTTEIQNNAIEGPEIIKVLAHISCMTTSIDFKLPYKVYKYIHSSWFCASLVQVVNEATAIYNAAEWNQMRDITARIPATLLAGITRMLTGTPVQIFSYTEGFLKSLIGEANEYALLAGEIKRKSNAFMELILELKEAMQEATNKNDETTNAASSVLTYMELLSDCNHHWEYLIEFCDTNFLVLFHENFTLYNREITRIEGILTTEEKISELDQGKLKKQTNKIANIAANTSCILSLYSKMLQEHEEARLETLDLLTIKDTTIQKKKVMEIEQKCNHAKFEIYASPLKEEQVLENFEVVLGIKQA